MRLKKARQLVQSFEKRMKKAMWDLKSIVDEDHTLKEELQPAIKEAEQLSDVDVEEGKMHRLLDVPEGKDIKDGYSPEEAVDTLVDKTGDEKEAAGMINYAANINPENDFFQDMQDHLAETDYPE
jgi:hypothetical protein